MVIVFYLLLVVWSVFLCVGFRLPLLNVSNSKNIVRQMAYNVFGLCVRAGFETPNFKLSTDDK